MTQQEHAAGEPRGSYTYHPSPASAYGSAPRVEPDEPVPAEDLPSPSGAGEDPGTAAGWLHSHALGRILLSFRHRHGRTSHAPNRPRPGGHL